MRLRAHSRRAHPRPGALYVRGYSEATQTGQALREEVCDISGSFAPVRAGRGGVGSQQQHQETHPYRFHAASSFAGSALSQIIMNACTAIVPQDDSGDA